VLTVVSRTATRQNIDLPTVRETINYILSDCKERPDLEGIAAALVATIVEIDRATAIAPAAAQLGQPTSARFIPACQGLAIQDERELDYIFEPVWTRMRNDNR
jgi:hypothetical protein